MRLLTILRRWLRPTYRVETSTDSRAFESRNDAERAAIWTAVARPDDKVTLHG